MPEVMEGYWMAIASGFGLEFNFYKAGKSIDAGKVDAGSFVPKITLLNQNLAKGLPE